MYVFYDTEFIYFKITRITHYLPNSQRNKISFRNNSLCNRNCNIVRMIRSFPRTLYRRSHFHTPVHIRSSFYFEQFLCSVYFCLRNQWIVNLHSTFVKSCSQVIHRVERRTAMPGNIKQLQLLT